MNRSISKNLLIVVLLAICLVNVFGSGSVIF